MDGITGSLNKHTEVGCDGGGGFCGGGGGSGVLGFGVVMG